MPLDTAEGIEDAFKALSLGQKILAVAKSLPPVDPGNPRKFADFAPIIRLVEVELLPLVDQVIADVAD